MVWGHEPGTSTEERVSAGVDKLVGDNGEEALVLLSSWWSRRKYQRRRTGTPHVLLQTWMQIMQFLWDSQDQGKSNAFADPLNNFAPQVSGCCHVGSDHAQTYEMNVTFPTIEAAGHQAPSAYQSQLCHEETHATLSAPQDLRHIHMIVSTRICKWSLEQVELKPEEDNLLVLKLPTCESNALVDHHLWIHFRQLFRSVQSLHWAKIVYCSSPSE